MRRLNGTALQILRRKVEAFELDDPEATLPFTARLAREQGWTLGFAGQVTLEYKRFIILAMAAGHPVTPSEAVDQVWHLHLVYTRSYWQDLCAGVLGQELHHGPTRGGGEEQAKFTDWYAATLESYRRIFGEEPPPEIWPDPVTRFTGAGAGRWVDAWNCWIIPRPAWTRWRWWTGKFKR
jgi:hypothetical protein